MRILAATTVRNEGPYLLEWIAWHRLLGVTDFLFHSNDCDDGSDRLLDLLAEHGVIRHETHQPPPDKSVQWSALRAAWRHDLRKSTDWMLISDLDEFPVIHVGEGRFADLMAALPEGCDAVALPWRLFGSNAQIEISGRPVTQEFTRSTPAVMHHPIAATFFKSLFRPAAFRAQGVHRPRHRPETEPVWADGSGRPLAGLIAGNDKRLSLISTRDYRRLVELHHYSLRSAQGFIVKSDRGLPNRTNKPIDLSYWVARNFNTEENTSALRLGPRLNAEISTLMALPGVAELHQAALDWHRARFDELVLTPEGFDLYAHILLAQDSAVMPIDKQDDLLRLFPKLQRGSDL